MKRGLKDVVSSVKEKVVVHVSMKRGLKDYTVINTSFFEASSSR